MSFGGMGGRVVWKFIWRLVPYHMARRGRAAESLRRRGEMAAGSGSGQRASRQVDALVETLLLRAWGGWAGLCRYQNVLDDV